MDLRCQGVVETEATTISICKWNVREFEQVVQGSLSLVRVLALTFSATPYTQRKLKEQRSS